MKNIKTLAIAIVLILIIAITSVAILFSNQPKEDTIKIGVIVPLTGNFALQGERIKNGMELAREDLIAEDNETIIEIIYEDACLPKDAISAANKLIDIDNVSMIGGSFCLIGLSSIIPITEEKNIIVFNTAANPDDVLGKDNIFSTNIAIKDDAKMLAEFSINRLEANTSAIVYYVTPLGQDYGKYFRKYFEESGGFVVSEHQTELSQSDFRGELIKIKDKNPDVIFVVHLSNSLGNFIKEAGEFNINSTIISISEAEDPNVLEVAGIFAEGFIFLHVSRSARVPSTFVLKSSLGFFSAFFRSVCHAR